MTELDLVQKGLTETEAAQLNKWIAEGKPGLHKHRAESLGAIFCLGYSCQEIQRWFPEYPIEILLHARVTYDWDGARSKYRAVVHNETLAAAVSVRMESLRFLADVVAATHLKWRRELLSFMANPDKSPVPSFLPDTTGKYGNLLTMMDGLMMPPGSSKSKDPSSTGDTATPLVSIHVGQKDGKPDINISQSKQEDVKKALMEEAAKKNGQ